MDMLPVLYATSRTFREPLYPQITPQLDVKL